MLYLLRGNKRGEGYILSLRISLRGRAAQRQVTASASQLVTLHALLIQRERSKCVTSSRDRVNEGVIAVKQSQCVCVCVNNTN